MTRQHVSNRAFELHNTGFHCAEAVLLASLEQKGIHIPGGIPRFATCFGGGVGKTHTELCGALSGGLIALGCLSGRDEPGADWDKAASLAAEFRKRFLEEFGSSTCKDILASLGDQENMIKCKRLSGATAGLLFDLLEQGVGDKEGSHACCCKP